MKAACCAWRQCGAARRWHATDVRLHALLCKPKDLLGHTLEGDAQQSGLLYGDHNCIASQQIAVHQDARLDKHATLINPEQCTGMQDFIKHEATRTLHHDAPLPFSVTNVSSQPSSTAVSPAFRPSGSRATNRGSPQMQFWGIQIVATWPWPSEAVMSSFVMATILQSEQSCHESWEAHASIAGPEPAC